MSTDQALRGWDFPRPKVEGGQLWYEGTRRIEVVDEGEFLRLKYSWSPQFRRVDKTEEVDSSNWYIAPNEELIKSEIEKKYPVQLFGGGEGRSFYCSVDIKEDTLSFLGDNPLLAYGENFAEACAEAWIRLRELKAI